MAYILHYLFIHGYAVSLGITLAFKTKTIVQYKIMNLHNTHNYNDVFSNITKMALLMNPGKTRYKTSKQTKSLTCVRISIIKTLKMLYVLKYRLCYWVLIACHSFKFQLNIHLLDNPYFMVQYGFNFVCSVTGDYNNFFSISMINRDFIHIRVYYSKLHAHTIKTCSKFNTKLMIYCFFLMFVLFEIF